MIVPRKKKIHRKKSSLIFDWKKKKKITLLQIKFNGLFNCFCDSINQENCVICKIMIDFDGFEDELIENMKNVDFLKKYQSKLYRYLSKLVYINKLSICWFLDGEYFYLIRKWSGWICQLFLSEMIEQIENANLKKIKKILVNYCILIFELRKMIFLWTIVFFSSNF